MAGEQQGAARKAPEGIAVSSGDSSAPTPRRALNSDPGTPPDVNAPDITYAGTEPPPRIDKLAPGGEPKSDPSDAATIINPVSPSSGSPPHPIFSHIGATIFHEGDVIGGRYEIRKMLGMGGMGAVYQARDMEVERVVGLKVIRPDLAGNPAILARFKQELVLARQVTHKNIIRIYDLNEADGVKFITMEFIEGEDLRSILTRQGKLSPDEAAGIMVQVCTGLQAAHSEGIVHRDLKPSNIMRDTAGRVVIMDFGLARTIQGDGMTQTGMMIGTMEYMSPEQAMGKELDARSDLFALGLIFYELLSGFIPFRAESAIASLVKRTQERAVPLSDVDAAIPPTLSEIVSKCLEREPDARFASVQELIDELEIWQGKKSRSGQSAISRPPVRPAVAPRKPLTKWIAIAAAVIVLAVGAVVLVRHNSQPPKDSGVVQGPVTMLAIVPFYNASGDPSLTWLGGTIASTLSSDIGGSTRLRLVSLERLQQGLSDLQISPQSQIDLQTLKRLAQFTNADMVVYGQYEKVADQIRIEGTVADLKNDRNVPFKVDAAAEKDLPNTLDKLAEDLRQKLATSDKDLNDLRSRSQQVMTKSVEALRAYNEGLQLLRDGDNTKAVNQFEDAVRADPNFALAYSKLAQTYSALAYGDKAEQASRHAMDLSGNLPTQDRYLIEAGHAEVMHDNAKAIAAYENLVKLNPGDTDAQLRLAKLYEDDGNFDAAKKALANLLATDPNNIAALLASGRVDINMGNDQAALEPLLKAQDLAIRLDKQEEKGAIFAAMGVAYQDLNKPDDALRYQQQALDIRKKVGDQRGVASTLGQVAQLQEKRDPKAALASYNEAIEIQRKIGDKKGLTNNLLSVAGFYVDHGEPDQALQYANQALQVARDNNDEVSQVRVLGNIGVAHSYKGEYQDALTYYQQAYDLASRLKIQDGAVDALHNLALTNAKLGQYDAAVQLYLKAMEMHRAASDKAGAALEASDMSTLFVLQGRYDAALKAQQEAVNTYKQLNDSSYLAMSALAGYGHTLSAVGREDEGQRIIEEALKLAPTVKNVEITSEALNYLGDSYFYQGNYAAARSQYEKALQLADKAKVRTQVVIARLNLARLDLAEGKFKAALPILKKLKEDADSMGLKAESLEASIYLAQAMLASNHPDTARDELDNALGRAEKLGLLVDQARAQYLLGKAMLALGQTGNATPHFREAVRILEAIAKQEGAGRVLERSDLKDMYREAAKAYQGGA